MSVSGCCTEVAVLERLNIQSNCILGTQKKGCYGEVTMVERRLFIETLHFRCLFVCALLYYNFDNLQYRQKVVTFTNKATIKRQLHQRKLKIENLNTEMIH